jgi:type IV secretion system protein VirD4
MPNDLQSLRSLSEASGGRLYLGKAAGGLVLGDAQHSALVLGPPRSGKTTALAIPNTLSAPGAVIVTSTKPDILSATLAARSELGQCWLLDPMGTMNVPSGVRQIRWSPVASAGSWDASLVLARAMTGAARPSGRWGESAHWTERAEALLAPLLHAAHLQGAGIETVLTWVLRHHLDEASAALRVNGATIAADVLSGIAATDPREQSGIWSSAAGVLAAYRSERVLDNSAAVNFDPSQLFAGTDTVYVCAPARHQELAAPIVVAFLDQARAGCYAAWGEGHAGPPLTLVLDELANVAPIPDLPALVSEGGSQGVMTMACLQDLSQARGRWGPVADGFVSLFGAKVILPGIGDLQTLELVSRLGGDVDIQAQSKTSGPWWSASRAAPTITWANQRQRRLPVDAVNQQPRGSALLVSGSDPPRRVNLPPWWAVPIFQRPTVERRPAGRSIER